MKKTLIVMALALMTIAGCAGMTPQQTTTNTLLGVHDTIVAVETGIKQPCAQGTIPAADCTAIEGFIFQAKPAYNAAVDAQLVWLSSNTATDQASYLDRKQALDQFVGDAIALALKYGVKEPANGSSN